LIAIEGSTVYNEEVMSVSIYDFEYLTSTEQKELRKTLLKQFEAEVLKQYLNCVAEPKSESERQRYLYLIDCLERLKEEHTQWESSRL